MNIVILSHIWPTAIDELRQRHEVQMAVSLSPAELRTALKEAEVAVLRSGVMLDRAALEAAPRLRLIVRAGAGLEGIDRECAKARGVRVICAPLSAESVAEHTLGLILSLAHSICRHDAALRAGRWEKHSSHGWDLWGRTLGLIGFGRIGRRTAELGRVFGMTVLACDRSPEKPAKQEAAARFGLKFVGLDELLAASDVVAIQTPLDDSTRGLIGARRIGLMRPSSVLINVGRGGIIDEEALFAALCEGRLAGAALDVFAKEPPGKHPLLALPNFIGTPHVAAQTVDSQEQVGRCVVKIISAYAAGQDWAAHGLLVV